MEGWFAGMLFPWFAAKGEEDKPVPGVHTLVLPSFPVPLGPGGKRGCMYGEGWPELDTTGMGRGRALHPVAISDTAFQAVGVVQVGSWSCTPLPAALCLI